MFSNTVKVSSVIEINTMTGVLVPELYSILAIEYVAKKIYTVACTVLVLDSSMLIIYTVNY